MRVTPPIVVRLSVIEGVGGGALLCSLRLNSVPGVISMTAASRLTSNAPISPDRPALVSLKVRH